MGAQDLELWVQVRTDRSSGCRNLLAVAARCGKVPGVVGSETNPSTRPTKAPCAILTWPRSRTSNHIKCNKLPKRPCTRTEGTRTELLVVSRDVRLGYRVMIKHVTTMR